MKYLFVNFLLLTFLFSKECTYPFQFKFNEKLFYPFMTTSLKNNPSYMEISLKNANDEYVSLINHLPAIYSIRNTNLKNIFLNKNLDFHKFKKEIKKKYIILKIYSSISETLIFIFRKNDFMGTLIMINMDEITKSEIIDSLNLNSNICTKQDYKKLYSKTNNLEINKKLKLLYSILFIDLKNSFIDKDIKKEIITVLKNKQKIDELGIVNLN